MSLMQQSNYNYYMTTPLRSDSNLDSDFNESIASWITSTGGACTASQKLMEYTQKPEM